MIVVIGQFRLPVHSLSEARNLMAQVVADTRREAGCLTYSYSEDVTEPGLIHASETWESREALTAHFKTPHMIRWQAERQRLGMTGRVVMAYAVAAGEAL